MGTKIVGLALLPSLPAVAGCAAGAYYFSHPTSHCSYTSKTYPGWIRKRGVGRVVWKRVWLPFNKMTYYILSMMYKILIYAVRHLGSVK